MSESRLSSFYRFSSWDHVLVVLWYCGTLKHCGTVVLPHAGGGTHSGGARKHCGTVVLWYFYVPVVVHWYTGAGTRAGVAPKLALQAHKSSTLAATKPDN